MSDLAPFELPNDVEAILDELQLDLDPAMRKRVSNAVAMLLENNRAIEDRMSASPFGFFPVVEADPSAPAEGQVWANSTSDSVRIFLNGTTRDFTIT